MYIHNICIYIYMPVVPGQAGGGSFHSTKEHKPVRTRRPIEKHAPAPIPPFSVAFAQSTLSRTWLTAAHVLRRHGPCIEHVARMLLADRHACTCTKKVHWLSLTTR